MNRLTCFISQISHRDIVFLRPLLLFFVFLSFSTIAWADRSRYDYTAHKFAYKTYDEYAYRWSDWTDWSDCLIHIIVDLDNSYVEINSERYQRFTIYEYSDKKTDSDGFSYELSCRDLNGNRCTVRQRFLDSGGAQFYCDYADIMYVYQATTGWSDYSGNSHYNSSSYNSNSSSATIARTWVEHNQYFNGQKGMYIHVKFTAYNVYNHKIGPVLHFCYTDGTSLRDTNGEYGDTGGKVSHSQNQIASYKDTSFDDFKLFFPYSELHMVSGCKDQQLMINVDIYDWSLSTYLSQTEKIYFNFSN